MLLLGLGSGERCIEYETPAGYEKVIVRNAWMPIIIVGLGTLYAAYIQPGLCSISAYECRLTTP